MFLLLRGSGRLALTSVYRKDDYAFFLEPVNPAQVPGYADVIKNPMDFGTITTKVQRGKYRSLEEFAVCMVYSAVRNLAYFVRPE